MAGLSGVSDYIKITLLLVLITLFFITFSYFAPYWVVHDGGHAGLWQGCVGKTCYDRWALWEEKYVRSCQVFVTSAYVLVFWTLFLLVLFIFHPRWEQDKRLLFLSAVSMFITCGMMFFAVSTWAGAQYLGEDTHLSWCFAMACLSMSTSIFSVVFLVMDMRRPVVLDEAHQLLIEASVYGEDEYVYKLPASQKTDVDTTYHDISTFENQADISDTHCI